jgi:hypothetical protein
MIKLFKKLTSDKTDKVREEINVDDISSIDDSNIITTIKSIILDDINGWEVKFDPSSINITKKNNGTGLKLSYYYSFYNSEFSISNLFLTYFPKDSSYIQTNLKNKKLLTGDMIDFFYKIYYNQQIEAINLSKKEMELKNKTLQNVIGKANLRDSKLDDLLN